MDMSSEPTHFPLPSYKVLTEEGEDRDKNRLTASPSELEVHSQTLRLAGNQHIWREFVRCSVVHWS